MNKQVWIEKALGLGIQEFEIYQSTTVEKRDDLVSRTNGHFSIQ